MSSKRLFSWSRRQSGAEPYYKTGGLLSIEFLENESSNNGEAKDSQNTRRRPSNLSITPPDDQQFVSSPLSSPYNVTRISSASNLMSIFNDMLRSPGMSAGACSKSASAHNVSPVRPRSASMPATPELPTELPGSLLQHNQGYPYPDNPEFTSSRPISQNVRRGTHPPNARVEDEGDIFDILHLFPEPLNHSKSVPSLNAEYRQGAMKSSRIGPAASVNNNKSQASRAHHRRGLSETEWYVSNDTSAPPHSGTDATGSPSNVSYRHPSNGLARPRVDYGELPQLSPKTFEASSQIRAAERRSNRRDDLGATLTPTPAILCSDRVEEISAANTTPDETIATLRSQFRSLRTSHEVHVSNLAAAHAAELASLRDYTKLLEGRLAQRPDLQYDVTTPADPQLAPSKNPLYLLNTGRSSSTPSREGSYHTAGTSASPSPTFRSASETSQQAFTFPQDGSEMETLKRKLSTTRGPSTADRNLLPELNQYKQNNTALQTQISSLMAKLNESKKSEKALKASIQEAEQRCAEAERKTGEAEELASSARALQNTIDHLESRLEIANTEKLDAQEELFNMRALKSPFDAQFPELQDAHESMDTVFSNTSIPGRQRDSTATMSEFIHHIELLQDEVRHKDEYIADLERDSNQLRRMLDHVNQQYDELNLQLDIQNELLGKAKETDAQIEQLRTSVIDRETVIAEKEKSVRAVERQLEHHKLLLQAEIRKHATMSRYFSEDSNPLPELSTLATKKDIDRWVQRLNQRLRKVKSMSPSKASATAPEAHIEDLRNEIDFYVREIIYYKLDIRGYKSDIKKLNKIMAQLGNYGNRSDLDSDTSSLRPVPTPNQARFLATTPSLKGSEQSSPALNSATIGPARTLTPPLSVTAGSTSTSPTQQVPRTSDDLEEAASRIPVMSQTPTKITIISVPQSNPEVTSLRKPHIYRGIENSGDDRSEMLSLVLDHPEASSSRRGSTVAANSRPTSRRDVSDASIVRPVIPTSKFSQDMRGSSLPPAIQTSHKRVGSGSSVLTYNLLSQPTTPRAERQVSGASNTGIPFVIAMTSPHNPAIAVAAKNMPAIRPFRSASRAGVDGTMASTTPISSPISIQTATPVLFTNSPSSSGHRRKLSLSLRKPEIDVPATPKRARSMSSGSIRTAIRWTKGSGREKDRDPQIRKDSVQPLGSPLEFGHDSSLPADEISAVDFAAGRRV